MLEVPALDELVAFVAQKTGLSEEQARSAAETVLGFLKSKLPEPLACQIDGLISGEGGGGLGDALKGLGGLFGKK